MLCLSATNFVANDDHRKQSGPRACSESKPIGTLMLYHKKVMLKMTAYSFLKNYPAYK